MFFHSFIVMVIEPSIDRYRFLLLMQFIPFIR
jgi:hypothetical protein